MFLDGAANTAGFIVDASIPVKVGDVVQVKDGAWVFVNGYSYEQLDPTIVATTRDITADVVDPNPGEKTFRTEWKKGDALIKVEDNVVP